MVENPSARMFSYYDPDADIAWFPTGESNDVVSERVPDGLRDYDRATHKLVATEVWDASTRFQLSTLDALPAPSTPQCRSCRHNEERERRDSNPRPPA